MRSTKRAAVAIIKLFFLSSSEIFLIFEFNNERNKSPIIKVFSISFPLMKILLNCLFSSLYCLRFFPSLSYSFIHLGSHLTYIPFIFHYEAAAQQHKEENFRSSLPRWKILKHIVSHKIFNAHFSLLHIYSAFHP